MKFIFDYKEDQGSTVLYYHHHNCDHDFYFLLGVKGVHDFDEVSVRKVLRSDVDKASLIEQDSDVATANNRIEYFLDTAEKRIRDAALCGWNYKGKR